MAKVQKSIYVEIKKDQKVSDWAHELRTSANALYNLALDLMLEKGFDAVKAEMDRRRG